MNKVTLRIKAIFEGGLATSHKGKGYQATFPEFSKILKDALASLPSGGPIDVDLDTAAIDQLSDAVKSIMNLVTKRMLQLLKRFIVVEGNGLSPFATTITLPEHLLHLLGA